MTQSNCNLIHILILVLREKSKDKWSNYASKFTDLIDIEEKGTPRDKWSSYAKNCISIENSPLMKKAEKKIEKKKKTKKPKTPRYSSDESDDNDTDADRTTDTDSDSDPDAPGSAKKKKKSKEGKKAGKKKKKNETHDPSSSEESENETDNEKDKRKKTKKSNKNQIKKSSKKHKNSDTESDEESENENKGSKKSVKKKKEKSDSDTDHHESDNEFHEMDHKLALLEQLEKPVPDEPTLPKTESQKLPETNVDKHPIKNTAANHGNTLNVIDTSDDRNYKNGPIVDFHKQIRRISNHMAPNIEELETPSVDKSNINDDKPVAPTKSEDIHDAIDDILSNSPQLPSRKSSQEAKSKQPQTPQKMETEKRKQPSSTIEDELHSLEESILANHENNLSQSKQKKESTVDDLLMELNMS